MRRDSSVAYAKKRDANQSPIVDALRDIGVGVYDSSQSGNGLTDLICIFRGKVYLLEVKNPEGRGSRLTPAQVDFHQLCRMHGYEVRIVETVEQAMAVFGAR